MKLKKKNESGVRCYVCGRDAGASFYLFSMSRDVDRVFIVHEGACLDLDEVRQDDVAIALHVTRLP